MIRKFFMIALAVLLFSSLAFSQTGKISGKVFDRETGEALPGANVNLVGTSLGAATDINGYFTILSVPVGGYVVKATFIGYRNVNIEDVRVNTELTTSLDFGLPAEAVEVGEITIIAERPLVNKNATNAVRIQTYEDLKNLPVRGVNAAVALQPGVVTFNDKIYIRGGRENDVGYFLEGANARDRRGQDGALGGSAPISVIPEALEEFQLEAGGYTAQFGGANAGIIRQTLKSGGADYGFTFQFETDDFASQGDKFLGTHSYGYRDITATVGGPVPGMDNLRFFVAGERRTVDDRVQRFNNGFNFSHIDEETFAAMSPAEQQASIDAGRFPFILEETRNAVTEAAIQAQGLNFFDGNTFKADREEWVGNGSLTLDAKPFLFRLAGSLTQRKQSEVQGRIPIMLFNQDRIEQEEFSSALINLKMTHLLGANTFYDVSINYFDVREHQYDPIFEDNYWALWDSSANAAQGIQFFGQDAPWQGGSQAMELYGFNFIAPGSPAASNTIKRKRNYWGGSFNFLSQLSKHEVKFGASYERWTVRNFQLNAGDALALFRGARSNPDFLRRALGDRSDPDVVLAQAQLSSTARANEFNYGYDIFGNEVDEDGLAGPRHPKYVAVYLQDKFEVNDLVINAGVRLDIIDNDDFTFEDLANPPWDVAGFTLFEDQLVETDNHVEISPRLGIAFPVSDRTVFHLQYGRFVQAVRQQDLYQGGKRFNDLFTAANSFQTNLFGLDLKPEVTTQYEIGFNQQFTDNAAFDITTFYKNIKDQLQVVNTVVDAGSIVRGNYNLLQNLDFATTAGVEFSMTLRRTSRLAAQVNYTFARALGTGSTATSAIAAVEGSTTVPSTISPLDFHRAQVGSFNLDYRFGRGDGGPILEQLGVNLLLTFQSGHPYTLSTGTFGQQDEQDGGQSQDPRFRFPLEAVNQSITPWNFQIDLRVDKSVSFGRYRTNFYFYVQNLTNRRNVLNVYGRTGNAYNDGFLDDAELSGSILDRRDQLTPGGAAVYTALYQAINLNGNGFNFRASNTQSADGNNGVELLGIPRQIRVGARIEL